MNLRRRYLVAGLILLPVSAIGVYLSANALGPYNEYAWNNGFVPSGIGFTMSILNGTFLGFFAVGAFGLVFVLYGMFKPASNAEQRADLSHGWESNLR